MGKSFEGKSGLKVKPLDEKKMPFPLRRKVITITQKTL